MELIAVLELLAVLKRHQRSAYRAMQRRLFNLWKQYEDGQRNSKELEACSHLVQIN